MAILSYLAIAVLSFALWRFVRNRLLPPLPPGPRRLPLIGNLLQYPTRRPWEVFHLWSKEHKSDIIHLNVTGTSIVVLDSHEAAWELFERRGGIYSSRPSMPMLTDLMGWDDGIVMLPYGNVWREHRRVVHKGFGEKASMQYRPDLTKTCHTFLFKLLKDPQLVREHLYFVLSQATISATYGFDVTSQTDPRLVHSDRVMVTLTRESDLGKYLVNAFPVLKHVPTWFPGAQFKRDAMRWREDKLTTTEMMIVEAEKSMKSPDAKPSMVSNVLAELHDDTEAYKNARSLLRPLSSMVFIGSVDTTVATLDIFLLCMVLYPDAQRKAQEELDRVLGHVQLPSFHDEEALPYVSALVKECLRWHPPAPLGMPHFIEAEDMYEGYRIPAKTIVLANIWGILHDEEEYPDPLSFKPERFLKNGRIDTEVKDPLNNVFGLGRRICPGRHHAAASMWIFAASILASFDVSSEVDDAGVPIPPVVDFESSLAARPKPFKCIIKPRSKKAEETLLGLEEVDRQ